MSEWLRAVGARAPANDIGENGFALDLVRLTDDRRLGHARVRDERGFDFHRAQAMARDIQDIIDPTHDPVIAVLVALRAVARDVKAVLKFLPVGLDVALVVAPDGAQHRRPGLFDDEIAAGVGPA